MKKIHWFRQDLRLVDNAGVEYAINDSKQTAFIYFLQPSWFRPNQWGFVAMGEHRKAFVLDSLRDLNEQLSDQGHQLYVVEEEPEQLLPEIIKTHDISVLTVDEHHGVNERRQLENLHNALPDLAIEKGNSHYLYDETSLPFSLDNTPDKFSPFRKKVEKYAKPRVPSPKPDLTSVAALSLNLEGVNKIDIGQLKNTSEYSGGYTGAMQRVNEYFFETDRIATYKQTRNGLDGWDFSSRLSAYLAHGCISPASVAQELEKYEQTRTKNDSTYWLFFELLWREFFHWSHKKHGIEFFKYNGINGYEPGTKANTHLLNDWINGTTGYKIVDAFMRQIAETGFMSNRGRQLVASCFVHELGMDWRYGAAYFEQALIDFDVASNYGNWQYLAGVGSDPRGHRQFNLEKQANTYDPNNEFVEKWLK